MPRLAVLPGSAAVMCYYCRRCLSTRGTELGSWEPTTQGPAQNGQTRPGLVAACCCILPLRWEQGVRCVRSGRAGGADGRAAGQTRTADLFITAPQPAKRQGAPVGAYSAMPAISAAPPPATGLGEACCLGRRLRGHLRGGAGFPDRLLRAYLPRYLIYPSACR